MLADEDVKEREQADDKEILGENVFMFEGENVKRQMDRSKICVECIGASNHRGRPVLLVAAVTRLTGEHEDGLSLEGRRSSIGLPDLGNDPREESLQFREPV